MSGKNKKKSAKKSNRCPKGEIKKCVQSACVPDDKKRPKRCPKGQYKRGDRGGPCVPDERPNKQIVEFIQSLAPALESKQEPIPVMPPSGAGAIAHTMGGCMSCGHPCNGVPMRRHKYYYSSSESESEDEDDDETGGLYLGGLYLGGEAKNKLLKKLLRGGSIKVK
jgi:hypothetical protein